MFQAARLIYFSQIRPARMIRAAAANFMGARRISDGDGPLEEPAHRLHVRRRRRLRRARVFLRRAFNSCASSRRAKRVRQMIDSCHASGHAPHPPSYTEPVTVSTPKSSTRDVVASTRPFCSPARRVGESFATRKRSRPHQCVSFGKKKALMIWTASAMGCKQKGERHKNITGSERFW